MCVCVRVFDIYARNQPLLCLLEGSWGKQKGEESPSFRALRLRGRGLSDTVVPFVLCPRGDPGWVFLSVLHKCHELAEDGRQGNRSFPCDLGPFTVGSHQTCISRAISPAPGLALARSSPKRGLQLNSFQRSETPQDVSPVFQPALLPEIMFICVFCGGKVPAAFHLPAPQGLRRGKEADVITPPGIRGGAAGGRKPAHSLPSLPGLPRGSPAGQEPGHSPEGQSRK